MPDQMKPRFGAASQQRLLAFKLLHIIFAEVAQTKAVSLLDCARRKFLGYRDKRNVGAAAAGPLGRSSDARFYFVYFFAEQKTIIRLAQGSPALIPAACLRRPPDALH